MVLPPATTLPASTFCQRPHDRVEIERAVLIEAAILDADDCVDDVRRHVLGGDGRELKGALVEQRLAVGRLQHDGARPRNLGHRGKVDVIERPYRQRHSRDKQGGHEARGQIGSPTPAARPRRVRAARGRPPQRHEIRECPGDPRPAVSKIVRQAASRSGRDMGATSFCRRMTKDWPTGSVALRETAGARTSAINTCGQSDGAAICSPPSRRHRRGEISPYGIDLI